MLTRNGYGKAVDWWALGALCFEMVVGDPPFSAKNQKDLDRKILMDKFVAPSYLRAETHSLLKGLLEKDMNKRLGSTKSTMFSIGGVAALKQHTFFVGLDWSALERCEVTPPINVNTEIYATYVHSGTSTPSVASPSRGEAALMTAHFDAE